MGFFSSRRTEPSPLSLSAARSAKSRDRHGDATVTQIIRSKFYGKGGAVRMDSQQERKPQFVPSVTSISESVPAMPSLEIPSSTQHSPKPRPSPIKKPAIRTSVDMATMTLAQRLNELAVANAEGLLDDEEYRLLRQSLFDRFSSVSEIPSETPIVPSAGPSSAPRRVTAPARPDNHARTASIRTQTSVTSIVSNLVRRTTRKDKGNSKSLFNDVDSVASISSRTSSIRLPRYKPRQVGRQTSDISLNTQQSRIIPSDTKSILSSRSIRTQSDTYGTAPRSVARSVRSGREPPPSSFSSRRLATWVPDDERTRTTAEIRSEIAETEAEARRLLDAFKGLELSALTRHRESYAPPAIVQGQLGDQDSTWTFIPDQASGFAPDIYSNRKMERNSRRDLEANTLRLDHLPTNGKRTGPYSLSNNSTLTVPNDTRQDTSEYTAMVSATMQAELDDIRRRRMEVTDRYQQRLDYLRARLKGAEIHEKLLRK